MTILREKIQALIDDELRALNNVDGEKCADCGKIILNLEKSNDLIEQFVAITVDIYTDFIILSSIPGVKLHMQSSEDKETSHLH